MKNDTRRALALLRPVIDERVKALEEFGEEWNDKPVGHRTTRDFIRLPNWLTETELPQKDVLQFLLDKGLPKGETPFLVAHRVLIVTQAATSNSTNVSSKSCQATVRLVSYRIVYALCHVGRALNHDHCYTYLLIHMGFRWSVTRCIISRSSRASCRPSGTRSKRTRASTAGRQGWRTCGSSTAS